MLDIRWMRENREALAEAMHKLNAVDAPWEQALTLDEERRSILVKVEALRAERNAGSKRVGELFRDKKQADAEVLKARMSEIGAEIAALDEGLRRVDADYDAAMLRIPNIPEPDVPVAEDESGNVPLTHWGEKPTFAFAPQPAWEIGERLGVIDMERGAKVAGSRMYFLRRDLARMQRALTDWFIDVHVQEHGYEELYPPFMVRESALVGTGNLPKFSETLFRDAEEDYWMIPTAEVPVTNFYRDEILDAAQLPVNLVAWSPCFRREKVSAGKDVRGIKRVLQFQKVEMVKLVEPGSGREELERLTRDAEVLLERLELPYRRLMIATGDLSFVAAIKYDLEVWAGGCEEWLEVSSCAFFRDFQARRMNLRYRPSEGAKPEFVHTLNGSGLAIPRILIAILENYQQADGSVIVPRVLRPYMGGLERIAAS